MSDGDGGKRDGDERGATEGYPRGDYRGDDPAARERQRAFNRANRDERATVHPDTEPYDIERFPAGDSTLHSTERDRVDADGARLCHLMCHIVTAAAEAGLLVRSLEEFPVAEWPTFEWLEREGEWYVQPEEPQIPLTFALSVEQPARAGGRVSDRIARRVH